MVQLAPAAPAQRHVLVVEDDLPIRAMLADLLADAGYAVGEAVDGSEALNYLRQQRPDLIVLDLMLPRISGWQFLERSRTQLEADRIPVLVLSAISGRGDYPATLGVAAWFTKPVDVPRFLSTVEQLAGPSQTDTRAEKRQPTVLLIEDERLIGGIVSEHLGHEGFAVELAGSVEDATALLTGLRPDLIVLDLMLPGTTGWDFLRQRQSDPALAAIPVLVMSAAPRERLQQAKELGANGFVSKPFDLDVLTALARSYAPV